MGYLVFLIYTKGVRDSLRADSAVVEAEGAAAIVAVVHCQPTPMISRRSDRNLSHDDHMLLFGQETRVVEALINAMEAKSQFLRGHSHRVAAVAAALAAELDLDDEEVELIRLAGQLHDIGKIGVREAVLDKPEKLTAEEFQHVQKHVEIGLNILSPLSQLTRIHEYIAHHHERIDGSGYPNGLSGESVSIGGRILGAADALDACTSPRAYREAMSLEQAITWLGSLGPRGICPSVLPALERIVNRGHVLVFINDWAA